MSSVRFGNVIGSRGSVIPLFTEQIRKGGPVTITNPKMLRFFMSIREAVQLTFSAMERMKGGELFILKMPVVRLGDLADVLIEEFAPRFGHKPSSVHCKVIGIRPGEKMREVLMTDEEAMYAKEMKDMFIVQSLLPLPGEDFPAVRAQERAKGYASSDVKPLKKEEVRALLRESLNVPVVL